MIRFLLVIMAFCTLLHASQSPVEVSLSGTVKDEAGAALKGVRISLAKIDDLSTQTVTDGSFTLSTRTSVLL
jgi:hypothetical protein